MSKRPSVFDLELCMGGDLKNPEQSNLEGVRG